MGMEYPYRSGKLKQSLCRPGKALRVSKG